MCEDISREYFDILHRINLHVKDDLYGLDQFNEEPCISATTVDGIPIRKLFIANLAERTTYKDLVKLFSKYGKIDSCYLKRNSNRSNYAFVTFNTDSDALKARLDGYKKEIHLHNRDLRVIPADSWHQPDSIENQNKLATLKHSTEKYTDNCDEQVIEEQTSEDTLSINKLNDDCLIHIFQFLPIVDRVRIERVCKRWHAISQESWRTCKSLNLSMSSWGFAASGNKFINTPILRKVLLRSGRFLNTIDFSQKLHHLSQSTLTLLGKLCPNVQTLNITALNVSVSGIQSLTKNCHEIIKFSLGSCTCCCDNDLQKLFMVNKKLQCLEIIQNSITGKCLLYLPSDTLEAITLIGCNDVSPCHFCDAMQRLHKLKSLTLRSWARMTDSVLEWIGCCADSLKFLELLGYFPMITSNGMNHITQLINLEELNVGLNEAVSDSFLSAVSIHCRNLVSLNVTGCIHVTDAGISKALSLPNLQHLFAEYLTITKFESNETVNELLKLKTLNCRGCPYLMNAGLYTIIETSPSLELLDFCGCQKINNTILDLAVRYTKKRTNNIVLKVYIGGTNVSTMLLKEVSPFLQIVNVDYSLSHLKPDFNHDLFFPLEDITSDDEDVRTCDNVSADESDDFFF